MTRPSLRASAVDPTFTVTLVRYECSYEVFQIGSEEFHNDPAVKKYKGEPDLLFTSPPCFAAEGYSDDETQSSVKFPTYDEWRSGDLRKTLETCVNYLKDDRWLIWNIADVMFSDSMLPISERDD